jgi:hypothetical protein
MRTNKYEIVSSPFYIFLKIACFGQKVSPEPKLTTKPPLSKNVDQQRNRTNNWHEQCSHCTARQTPEDQWKKILLFAQFRGTHLLFDQKHQQCPRRGLERTHLPKIGLDRIINLTTQPHFL